jgi:hypothetical protein
LVVLELRANYQVFGDPGKGDNAYAGSVGSLSINTVSDGSSNTVFFAEKFRRCKPGGAEYASLWGHGAWNVPYMSEFAYGRADGSAGYSNNSGYAGVVGPGSKFQVIPQTSQQCNPMMTQAIHTGAILAGLGDGSVRTVNGGVSGATWWAALTPSFGDLLGSDW